MRKRVFGRKFKRDIDERKALFKSLMSELVMHGRIKTTEQKAKAIKASAEKLITKARKEALLAKKLLSSELTAEAIVKVMTDIAPKFAGRNGGYTRIIRLGRRFNDDASMVLLEWVEGVGQVIRAEKGEVVKPARKTRLTEGEAVEAEVGSTKASKEKKAKQTKEKKTLRQSLSQAGKTKKTK